MRPPKNVTMYIIFTFSHSTFRRSTWSPLRTGNVTTYCHCIVHHSLSSTCSFCNCIVAEILTSVMKTMSKHPHFHLHLAIRGSGPDFLSGWQGGLVTLTTFHARPVNLFDNKSFQFSFLFAKSRWNAKRNLHTVHQWTWSVYQRFPWKMSHLHYNLHPNKGEK